MKNIALKGSTVALSLLVLVGGSPRPVSGGESDTAVLVLATIGTAAWNKSVKRAVKAAHLPYPYRLFFGSGDTLSQQKELQAAISSLEGQGANTITVIPLLISSFSQSYHQWKYLLGLDIQPGFNSVPLFPVKKTANIRFADPLNDSAVVVEILLDRAQEISVFPDKESVILVAEGPNDDSDNARWLQILQNAATRLKERGGYRRVEAIALREEAPSAVRLRAIQILRDRVKAAERNGSRALVVPLLLAPGGLENRISLELRGLNYVYNTKTLLPDTRISEWIRSQLP
jgi:sirohydrochlorin cobaltochelatase